MFPRNLTKTSLNEVISEAGLDWAVSKEPIEINGITFKGRFVTMRDGQTPLGIVRGVYKVVQNRDVFEPIELVREVYGFQYVSGGQIGRGERIYLVAEFPSDCEIHGQTHTQQIVLTNSHDGSSVIQIYPVDFAQAIYVLPGIKIYHKGNTEDKIKEGTTVIQEALYQLGHHQDNLKKMYQTPMSNLSSYVQDVVFEFAHLDDDEKQITAEDLQKYGKTLKKSKVKYIDAVNHLLDCIHKSQEDFGPNGYATYLGVLDYCNNQRYNGNEKKKFDSKFTALFGGKMRKFQQFALSHLQQVLSV